MDPCSARLRFLICSSFIGVFLSLMLPSSSLAQTDTPPASGTPSVREFIGADGRFGLEAARRSGCEGPLDPSGYMPCLDSDASRMPLLPTQGGRAEGDENWSGEFFNMGVDGAVWVLAIYDGDLILGGGFTQAGDIAAANIARWDGVEWHALGSGIPYAGCDAWERHVSALAVYDGHLIVGGHFSQAGGVGVSNIACWDGSNWSSLAGGVDDQVEVLMVHDGTLIVGGAFTHADGSAANRIATWNGSAWGTLGSGFNSSVHSLAVYDSALVAAGNFNRSGSDTVEHVASWNGAAWTQVGSGLESTVYALTVYDGKLVAGGGDLIPGDSTFVAQWDGMSWESVGGGVRNGLCVYALAQYGDDLVAAGYFADAGDTTVENIACWDGVSWKPLGKGLDMFLVEVLDEADVSLAVWQGELIVGSGFWAVESETPAFGIARWNGVFWNGIGASGQGMGGSVRSFCLYDGDLVVGGSFSYAGSLWVGNIAAWDGAGWGSLGGGVYREWLATVNAITVFNGDLIVGGYFTEAGDTAVANIACWDGSIWSPLDSGVRGEVHALHVYDGELIVAGDFDQAGGIPVHRIASWDGTSWSAMTDMWFVDCIHALATYDDYLIAGGAFESGDTSFVAKWDGASWSPLGGGLYDCYQGVLSLSVYDGSLVVGGDFLYVYQEGDTNLISANWVASWNGATWTPLGAGLEWGIGGYTRVQALGVYNDDLVAGGDFSLAGGNEAYNIARWDGSSWSALGSGTDAFPTPP